VPGLCFLTFGGCFFGNCKEAEKEVREESEIMLETV
jgi:hypothetical protein